MAQTSPGEMIASSTHQVGRSALLVTEAAERTAVSVGADIL